MSTLGQRVGTVGINVCATVGVVAANKILFNGAIPLTALSLTWLHYVSGAIFSRIAIGAGAFQPSNVPWKEVFYVYALNMAAIVCQNWSLQANPMDFYQLMKACLLPYSAAVDYFVKGQTLNYEAGLTVAGITVGAALVALNEVSSLMTTMSGLAIACLSVFITPLPIFAFGPLMRKHKVSSLQLFGQGSLAGAVMLTPVVLVELGYRASGSSDAEAAMRTSSHKDAGGPSFLDVAPVALLSCCCAYCINFTVNAMARDYAGVTYYVINNFKSTLILGMGIFVFGNGELPAQKALGMLICVVCQFLYPFAKKKVWPWTPGALSAVTAVPQSNDDDSEKAGSAGDGGDSERVRSDSKP